MKLPFLLLAMSGLFGCVSSSPPKKLTTIYTGLTFVSSRGAAHTVSDLVAKGSQFEMDPKRTQKFITAIADRRLGVGDELLTDQMKAVAFIALFDAENLVQVNKIRVDSNLTASPKGSDTLGAIFISDGCYAVNLRNRTFYALNSQLLLELGLPQDVVETRFCQAFDSNEYAYKKFNLAKRPSLDPTK
jgi:hypothetical protein